jgi:hypothetical protein
MEELIEKVQPRHKKIRVARKELIGVDGVELNQSLSVEPQEPDSKLDGLKNL